MAQVYKVFSWYCLSQTSLFVFWDSLSLQCSVIISTCCVFSFFPYYPNFVLPPPLISILDNIPSRLLVSFFPCIFLLFFPSLFPILFPSYLVFSIFSLFSQWVILVLYSSIPPNNSLLYSSLQFTPSFSISIYLTLLFSLSLSLTRSISLSLSLPLFSGPSIIKSQLSFTSPSLQLHLISATPHSTSTHFSPITLLIHDVFSSSIVSFPSSVPNL